MWHFVFLQAGSLVNPDPKTRFNQRLADKRESLYASKQTAPLGKSHDQKPGLPEGLQPDDVRFGTKNIFGKKLHQGYMWPIPVLSAGI